MCMSGQRCTRDHAQGLRDEQVQSKPPIRTQGHASCLTESQAAREPRHVFRNNNQILSQNTHITEPSAQIKGLTVSAGC